MQIPVAEEFSLCHLLEEWGHLGFFVKSEQWKQNGENYRGWNSSLPRVTFHRNCQEQISGALVCLFPVLRTLLIEGVWDAVGKGGFLSDVCCGLDTVSKLLQSVKGINCCFLFAELPLTMFKTNFKMFWVSLKLSLSILDIWENSILWVRGNFLFVP